MQASHPIPPNEVPHESEYLGLQQLAEFVSLTLTVPTVVLALTTVILFGPKAFKAIWNRKKEPVEEKHWLIAGIAIGFLGGSLDNLYWGAAWTAALLEHEWKEPLFEAGVWANIPFRQATGIIAAGFHIWAALTYSHARFRVLMWTAFSTVIGGVGLLIMVFGKAAP